MTALGDAFIARCDAVAARLGRLAVTDAARDALTPADAQTGERWEAGQVWAHLAEFVPYWLAQAEDVLAGDTGAVPDFGRTKRDPGRIAAIERDRATDRGALWQRVQGDLSALGAFIRSVPDDGWAREGRHPTLGVMSVERITDEFMVGHLEEHATQLEGLGDATSG